MTIPAPNQSDVSKPQAKKPKVPFQKQMPPQAKSSNEKENKNFSSLLTPNMINFYVGPKKKVYHIHRDLACSTNPIFKAHFGSLETKNPVTDMYLPNHDPKAFEIFTTFLYRGTFAEVLPPPQQDSSKIQPSTTQDIHGSNLDLLLAIHFMALDWQLQDLQNHSLDHICRYMSKASIIFRSSQIRQIYERVKNPKAPLRRFAVDNFIFRVMKKGVDRKTRQGYLVNRVGVEDNAFVWDLVEGVVGMRKYPMPVAPEAKGKCVYHDHPKGVQCSE